jgi:hypothetical protein
LTDIASQQSNEDRKHSQLLKAGTDALFDFARNFALFQEGFMAENPATPKRLGKSPPICLLRIIFDEVARVLKHTFSQLSQ